MICHYAFTAMYYFFFTYNWIYILETTIAINTLYLQKQNIGVEL